MAVHSLRQTWLKSAIPHLERAFADPNPDIASGARRLAEELKESGRPE